MRRSWGQVLQLLALVCVPLGPIANVLWPTRVTLGQSLAWSGAWIVIFALGRRFRGSENPCP